MAVMILVCDRSSINSTSITTTSGWVGKTSPPLNSYACIAACLTAMLGYPPCDKSGSPIKIISRAVFYSLEFLPAIGTHIQSSWDSEQVYTQLDKFSVES